MSTTLTQDQMNHLYNDINPTPHSEKAYQAPPDPSPPMAPKKTIADGTGSVTALVTCLYNRSGTAGVNYGSTAAYKIWGKDDSGNFFLVHSGQGAIPYRDDVKLVAGGYYWIQPITPNTQAKLLPTNVAK